MNKDKLHVYLMPGMAANSSIFENIRLPEDYFDLHLLDWFVPDKNMSLIDYSSGNGQNYSGQKSDCCFQC